MFTKRFTILDSTSHMIAICFALMIAQHAAAETYYVSQNGSDKFSGTSWSGSWRTLNYAAQQAVPGDTVIIRKGDKPYEHLRIIRSGEPGNPITFRSELPNDPPLISAEIPASEWMESHTPGVWVMKRYFENTALKQDNLVLTKASSPECLDGQWFWKDAYLYYRPTGGVPADHNVWTNQNGGIYIGEHSWIVLEDLNLRAGYGSGISIRGGNHNVIRRVNVKWHWRGINVHGGNHNLIEDCSVENNQEGIYLQEGASYNTVRNCRALYNGILPYWTTGDRHGIAVGATGTSIGNVIENSEVAYGGGPPEAVALISFQAPQTVFRNNYVHDNYGSGLAVTVLSDDSRVIGNIVENNGFKAVEDGTKGIFGLTVRGSKKVIVSDNQIFDNHVSRDSRYGPTIQPGPRGGIDIREAGARIDMTGIVLKNNKVSGTVGGPEISISKTPDTSDIVIEGLFLEPNQLESGSQNLNIKLMNQ